MKNNISKYGNEYITQLIIIRRPLNETITKLSNLISKGEVKNKLNESNYNDFYHLYAIIKTNKNNIFKFEKNEVLNLEKINTVPNGESINISLSGVPKQLNQAINRTMNRMGINDFLMYDAKTNNCQDLLINFLDANSYGSSKDRQFIKQDLDKIIFNDYPELAKLAKVVTDIAGDISSAKDTIVSEFKNISEFAEKKKQESIIGQFGEKVSQNRGLKIEPKKEIINDKETEMIEVEPSVVEDKPKQQEQENAV